MNRHLRQQAEILKAKQADKQAGRVSKNTPEQDKRDDETLRLARIANGADSLHQTDKSPNPYYEI